MKQEKKNKTNKNSHPKKFGRLFFAFGCLFVVLSLLFFVFKFTGLWDKVNSIDKLQHIVESGGMFSSLVFLLLQILQTTILQIPAFILTIAGALAFGVWKAFLLSYIGVLIGSIIMFYIGRKAGRKFLCWLVGGENCEKWVCKMSNGKYLFFLMMLFPLFPDDILCVVAGITDMSFKFFFWTNVLARGMGIASVVFFGSGKIIPFYGWGLVVWGVVALLTAILFYVSIKYKDRLDRTFDVIFKKKMEK